MSSISRARSPASCSVDAGPPTTSGAETGLFAQAETSRASVNRRSSSPSRGGISSGAAPPYCSASSAKAEFVLVDIAERDDARQYRGIRAQYVEKDFARQPPGAPGRQIERRVRKLGRILARLESIDQPALDQSGDDGAQERYGDGNAENTHGQPDSGSGGNIGGDFPSVMADDAVGPNKHCRHPRKRVIQYCRGVRD